MSRAPISSITDFTDPFDPAYAHQTWDSDDDEPNNTSYHTPLSPRHDDYPEYTYPGLPPLSSSALPSNDYESPPWATAPAYYAGPHHHHHHHHNNNHGYDVDEDDHRNHVVSPREASPERQPLHRNFSVVSAADKVEYQIPSAPPPPVLPPDMDIADNDRDARYDQTKHEFDSHPDSGAHQRHSAPPNVSGMARRPSVAHILGGALKGAVSRTRSSTGNRRSARKSRLENYTELDGVEEREEMDGAFNVSGFDLSSFGAEFVPAQAIKAMNDHRFNEDLAYTSSGQAIDLSSFTGLDYDDDVKDSDRFSIRRAATTFHGGSDQSFFFSTDRKIPNWKPVVLQTWYLVTLIILSMVLIGGIESLYWLSDKHVLRKGDGKTREGGGLLGFYSVEDLTVLQLSGWKYLPTLVGVIYGIVWRVTDEELKRTEPYYQLSKRASGALAAVSLNIEYNNIWAPFMPITAIKYRQWVVAAGGVISFLASSAVPVFLSVVVRVDPSQKHINKMKGGHEDDDDDDEDRPLVLKRLVVDALWTRLLELTLAIIIVLAIYIVVKLSRRRSGLLGDPSGIAGVAAMANNSHMLMDFNDLDLATEEKIHKQLNKRTYILHKGALWQAQALREDERDQSAPKAMNPHPLLLRLVGMGPFLIFILALIVLLPLVLYEKHLNMIMQKFPWVLTGIAVIIKAVWGVLEGELRMLEPFWILANRNAHSSVLTLDYTVTIPGAIIIKALIKGHWLLAWVATVTIFIEFLTVILGSLDSSDDEKPRIFVAIAPFIAISIFVITFATGLLVLKFRRHPFLPRQPGTISSVLAFIYQSKMLMDFSGTEQKSTLQRKRKLGKLGKRYGFGWYLGRDGKRHLGVDQEPLLEGYKFQVDPRAGVFDGPEDVGMV